MVAMDIYAQSALHNTDILPYGDATFQIVDEAQGGVIAYCHEGSADRIIPNTLTFSKAGRTQKGRTEPCLTGAGRHPKTNSFGRSGNTERTKKPGIRDFALSRHRFSVENTRLSPVRGFRATPGENYA